MHEVNSCPIAIVKYAWIIVDLWVLTLVIVLFSRHCFRSFALVILLCLVLLVVSLCSITVERCSKLSSLSLLSFLHVDKEWLRHTRLESAITNVFLSIIHSRLLFGIRCRYVGSILFLYHLPQPMVPPVNEAIPTERMALPFFRSVSRWYNISRDRNRACVDTQLINSSLTYCSVMYMLWTKEHVWTLITPLVYRDLHLRSCIIVLIACPCP